MIFRWLFLIIFIAIASTMLYVSFYIGLFRSAEVVQETRPGFYVVYQPHLGPYHKINPVIEEVEGWAQSVGINCPVSFGEYLDNPNSVDEHHLRSHGGCVIHKLIDDEDLPPGFASRFIPEGRFVVARFTGSPALGPIKVYPKAAKYIRRKQLQVADEVIELYETVNHEFMTQYLFRILEDQD